eukprot:snap_masked-scaffold13_size735724-processed-gene-4.5 protein:Tk03462 transcript:snap_masked-scaffold13_size735724-processed-gene-4.5-mRNA-1 annotation:"sperm-associated antigen 7 homolog"
MDLLNSIMSQMDKPPSLSEKEKAQRQKDKAMALKLEAKRKKMAQDFRTQMEADVAAFLADQQAQSKPYRPMEKFRRSVLHDVAEIAGLISHAFGEEDVDRHLILWKRDFPPSEDELTCRRAGQPWDPDTYYRDKQAAEQLSLKEEIEARKQRKQRQEKVVPKGQAYQAKYEHIIGEDALALHKTELNKSYGMVSADEKKDRRTVEDIQAELRAKKKLKLEAQQP